MTDYKSEYEALQKQYKALEAANRVTSTKQKIIDEVLHDISAELDINTILDLVAARAKELINAETLVVPIINEEEQRYYYLAASGKNAASILGTSFPINVGMCGWVLSSQSAMLFGENHEVLMGKQNQWEDGMESALLVPLISRGRIIGGLSGLGKKDGTNFDEEDKAALELFARYISLVIDNAIIFSKHEEEKERAEITLRSIGDAVITTNTNGEITGMNPVAEDLTGWNEADATGLYLPDVFIVMDTNTGQRISDPVGSVLEQDGIIQVTSHKTLLSKDGKEFHITDNAAPIKDKNNSTIGIILVFHNITESYEMRAHLEKEREQLKSIIDNTSAVIYVKDLQGKYTLINKRFESLFHISNDEIQGKTDYDIFSEEVSDEYVKNDRYVIENLCTHEYEDSVAHEDGAHTYISVKFPLFDINNEIYATCGVSTDITKHRQTEEALRRSQKMDAIGQLSGGIAHDFNNILSAILGNLELLELQSTLDEKVHKRINTIKHSAERAADLTKQLLGFSRTEATSTKATNINKVINGMQSLVVHSLTPQVEVKNQLADDLWLTEIDRGDFEDVLLNLVLNARDAMPHGGSLTLETSNCSLDASYCKLNPDVEPGDYVELAVSDSGKGILTEQQDRIFEPFYTTKPQGKGTGLGLAMVFGFVKRSRGNLKLYSEPGIGSTFRLYLPRAEAEEQPAEKTINEVTSMPSGHETILVVDDEIALLHLVEETLLAQGYNVITATNGIEAMQLFSEEPVINMLLSDVVMPGGMNGYELAEKMRASRPKIKVLLTSGYTEMAMARNGQARFNACLISKPYTLANLSSRVREILDEI